MLVLWSVVAFVASLGFCWAAVILAIVFVIAGGILSLI